MIDKELLDLSKYRMEKAKNDLESSQLMIDNGKFSQSANRAYYAMFHTTTKQLNDATEHVSTLLSYVKNIIEDTKT